MKNGKLRSVLSLLLLVCGPSLFAQAGSADNNSFVTILVAVVVLLAFFALIQVSDNLLKLEARQLGVADKIGEVSILPGLSDLFRPRVPAYAKNHTLLEIKRGADLPVAGEARKEVRDAQVTRFAVQPPNWRGLAPIPRLLVQVGDAVKAGDPLFEDKKRPEMKFVSPVSGEVIAINRGAKRAITEVVILADKDQQYREVTAPDLGKAAREELVEFLLETGGWMLLRERPYDRIPDWNDTPKSIFVSTFDTAPLAPDSNLVVEGKGEAFQKGLEVLNRLSGGKVYLGLDARGEEPPSAVFTEAQGVEKFWVRGPHPAGNVGVHIHHIDPIGPGDKVWTMGVQEVITLGSLWTEGRFKAERVIALTGSKLNDPHYVRTLAGANIGELLKDNYNPEEDLRFISGDVLSGEAKKPENFLNFYDDQVTVIAEGRYYELFGWLLPLKPRISLSRTFPNFLFKNVKYDVDTNTHGEKRAFVVTGQYEEVLPMDIYPQHLMKAILTNDYERMEGLGIYELIEEDIALAEFACTSKQPLQQILRRGLDMMWEQG